LPTDWPYGLYRHDPAGRLPASTSCGGFHNDAVKVLLKRLQCREDDIQVIGQSFFKELLIFIVDDTDITIG
jgi:hypothetical protein